MTGMNWDKARSYDRLNRPYIPEKKPRRGGPVPDLPPVSRRGYPITEKQRRYIAYLAGQAKVTVPKQVITRGQATEEIGRLKRIISESRRSQS